MDAEGGEALQRGRIVKTPYGWGRVREVREGFSVVKLDWATAYLQAENIVAGSRAPLGACVLTPYGTGVLVEFRRRDHAHVVRLWNRYGCRGTCLAHLCGKDILRVIRASANLYVETPHGSGTCMRYNQADDTYVVRLLGNTQEMVLGSADVRCPRARTYPLVESILTKLADLWRARASTAAEAYLTASTHGSQLRLTKVEDGGDEVEVKPADAVAAIGDQVKKALKDEKASDWLDGGRRMLLEYMNGTTQQSTAPSQGEGPGTPGHQINFWDVPSLLGLRVDGTGGLQDAWKQAGLDQLLSGAGPWMALAAIADQDHILADMLSEVRREWRMLCNLQTRFTNTKTIEALLQGMAKLQTRFESLAATKEFEFLQRRGLSFMNRFLSATAPSVSKAKQVVDVAQSRIEKALTEDSASPPRTATPTQPQANEGSKPQEPWTLTSALGLNVLTDLEALLQTYVTQLQSLGGALEGLRENGVTEQVLDQLEIALSVLLSLLEPEPPEINFPTTKSELPAAPAADGAITTMNGSKTLELPSLLKELGAPAAVHEVAERLSQGRCTLHEAGELVLVALDSEEMVAIAKGLTEHGDALLNRLEGLKDSPAFRAFLGNLRNSALEDRIFKELETVDAQGLVTDVESAFTDGSARQRMLGQLVDYLLEFLVEFIPNMPIEPITGLQEQTEYTISNLNLEGFKLQKEDVEVLVGEAAGDDMLVLDVKHIRAEFKQLQWRYEQLHFPNMKGEGVADAKVREASIRLGFRVKRRDLPAKPPERPQPTSEPVIILSSKRVAIGKIDLKVAQNAMSWLINILASLFSDTIRDYIVRSVLETIMDNMSDLLRILNEFARTSWPLLSRILQLELSSLPLYTEADEKAVKAAISPEKELSNAPPVPAADALDVAISIKTKGSLGMHVDVNEADNVIIIRGVSPQGAFAQALPSTLQPSYLTNAIWKGINGKSIEKMPVANIIPLVKRQPRPVILNLLLASPPPKPARSTLSTGTLTFSEPSAGIRFKPSSTIVQALTVASFARGPGDIKMPAEASGQVRVGQVLMAVNGILMRGKDMEEAVPILKSPERPMTLTFADSPDIEVVIREGEGKPDVALAAFDRAVVVTALKPRPGPLEHTGLCQLGDVLATVNGVRLPTGRGYMEDLDLVKTCTFPAKLTFDRPRWPGSEQVETTYEVVVPAPSKSGKWGAVFVRGRDERPVLRGWTGIPGPLQTCAKVKPGMVLLKMNDQPVSELIAAGVPLEEVIGNAQQLEPPAGLAFRDMNAYLLYMKWTPGS